MTQSTRFKWGRGGVVLAMGLTLAGVATLSVGADDRFHRTGFRNSDYRPTDGAPAHVPTLSEATALLESAVRDMYKSIEPSGNIDQTQQPGNTPAGQTSPNELLAYADLRALRLYVGALEVAGWTLEQSATDYQRYQDSGSYRVPGAVNDPQAAVARDRFQAYRETARTLLFRVRETAVSVEHQVSYCDPQVASEWQQHVSPALHDVITAAEPLFKNDFAFQNYGVPGQPTPTQPRVLPTSGGVPREAVDVTKSPTFAPFDRQGRGQGRFFEIRAFGGPVHVKAIRFRNHENSFGTLGTTIDREITVDQVAEPGQPLFIPSNRKRWCDVSGLEVDWETADSGRRSFGTIDLVETSPDEQKNSGN